MKQAANTFTDKGTSIGLIIGSATELGSPFQQMDNSAKKNINLTTSTMKLPRHFIILLAIFALAIPSQAQMSSEVNPYDARLLNHYTVEELDYLKSDHPTDFDTFTYYLTQSYSLEVISCNECAPIDASKFDISKYEYLRKKDETVVYDDPKHGFKLTVYSINTLQHLTPEQAYKLEH